jgi:magnesium transporter
LIVAGSVVAGVALVRELVAAVSAADRSGWLAPVVAAVCALAVWLWSGSLGLVAVISISMVFSMVCAGFSGAAIPILLNRLGFDPAQSSTIVLTTVTDIVGFFSFLGVATLLQSSL